MSDNGQPRLVSVIVPAYNRAATIAATLDTITSQTGWPFEILVIDDGSSDDTAAIARRHAPQARVVVQENQRRSAARNNGARLAAGELDYCEDYHFFLKISAAGGRYQCIGGPAVARYREYATSRIPGSIHTHGFVTALRMIAADYGDRIPPESRLDYYRARSEAAYSRHLLREGQTGKAWSTWLGSLDRCRTELFTNCFFFLGALIVPVIFLERVVYGGPRRIRDAWGWCLHQFGVGMKSVKTP